MEEYKRLIIIRDDSQRPIIIEAAKIAPVGTVVRFEPEKKRRIQEEKYHSMIQDIAKQDKRYDFEDWKRLLIDAYVTMAKENAKAEGKPEPFSDYGRVVPSLNGKGWVQLGVQSRKFTIKQASEFIEHLYYFGATVDIKWSV